MGDSKRFYNSKTVSDRQLYYIEKLFFYYKQKDFTKIKGGTNYSYNLRFQTDYFPPLTNSHRYGHICVTTDSSPRSEVRACVRQSVKSRPLGEKSNKYVHCQHPCKPIPQFGTRVGSCDSPHNMLRVP